MSNLIERLRKPIDYTTPDGVPMVAVHAYLMEAADEIERLQSHIAAMTKDIESMKPWRKLQEENRRLKEDRDLAYEAATTLKRENEELREELDLVGDVDSLQNQVNDLVARNNELVKELAALKAQSTEPVAVKRSDIQKIAKLSGFYVDEDDPTNEYGVTWYKGTTSTLQNFAQHLANTTPPTATTLVAD